MGRGWARGGLGLRDSVGGIGVGAVLDRVAAVHPSADWAGVAHDDLLDVVALEVVGQLLEDREVVPAADGPRRLEAVGVAHVVRHLAEGAANGKLLAVERHPDLPQIHVREDLRLRAHRREEHAEEPDGLLRDLRLQEDDVCVVEMRDVEETAEAELEAPKGAVAGLQALDGDGVVVVPHDAELGRPDPRELARSGCGTVVARAAQLHAVDKLEVRVLNEHLQAHLPKAHAEVVEGAGRLEVEAVPTAGAVHASWEHLAVEEPRPEALGHRLVLGRHADVPLRAVTGLLDLGAVDDEQQRLRKAMRLGYLLDVVPVLLLDVAVQAEAILALVLDLVGVGRAEEARVGRDAVADVALTPGRRQLPVRRRQFDALRVGLRPRPLDDVECRRAHVQRPRLVVCHRLRRLVRCGTRDATHVELDVVQAGVRAEALYLAALPVVGLVVHEHIDAAADEPVVRPRRLPPQVRLELVHVAQREGLAALVAVQTRHGNALEDLQRRGVVRNAGL
mmetsp:Transcript_34272/g.108063  ORF Transcript_34272/g.108063 Transcript_34272/m.108063 type:complete len:506 (-) Transcript_34272:394-1911(-)